MTKHVVMTKQEVRKLLLNALYGTAVAYKFKSDRFRYADTDSIRKENKPMKVIEKYEVPIESIPDFLADHVDEILKIKSITETTVAINIEQDYTEAELHMFHLRNFIESGEATPEEALACEYAINCIKTLTDMGVLNDDNSK